ncbi:MAG: NAD(+) synthase [Oscillospiraceae bacterium]|jgi:NAD+ synthase (glutamine-hydrolysing)|nr:NAD(+) synthase [Oscillospiraceae bacterium]
MTNNGYLRVAAISPRVTVANPAENAAEAWVAAQQALAAGAQVLALPELCLSGYTCGDLFAQSALLDACEDALRTLAGQTKGIAALVAVGLPVRALGRLYNCAAVLQNGKILGLVPKQYLPNTREYYEKRWFAPYAGEQTMVPIAGGETPFGRRLFACGACTVGVELCEDLWAPAPPSTQMALQGANVILNLSASDEEVAKQEYRRALVAQQSARLRCGYVYAGAGVGESSTDLLFSGACFVAENGRVLAEGPRFAQTGAAAHACLDLELLAAERRFGSFFEAPKGDPLPVTVCAPLPSPQHITRGYDPRPFVPQNENLRAQRCREIFDIQTTALAKRLLHTKLRAVILGLSGGLDSTLALLVAVRCADLLGWRREQVLGITMPGFGTTRRTRATVDDLAASLDITLWEIDIKPACALHLQDIGHDPNELDVTYENAQARERTQILMDLANQEQALLLGTGDLSELALGWCTYNADHMSMYNINCGVPKTLVRHLVEFLIASEEWNTDVGAALRRVLETPISPELLPPDAQGDIAQKTEDVVGSYEVHDFYLYHFFRFGFAPQKLHAIACRAFEGTHTPAQLKAWLLVFLRRFFAQQFKRSCLPDGPKVGSVSLSPRGDWRMPSDAAAALWVAQAEEIV